MVKVHITPTPDKLPPHGGVREHMIQLYRQARRSSKVEIVANPLTADILHVESAYEIPHGPGRIVYVCHGGFLPEPLPVVMRNLAKADVIVTVADWMVDQFFPSHRRKTVHIPNGVDLDEFTNLPPVLDYRPGFVLYAKEYLYWMASFVQCAQALPGLQFVSTVWPVGQVVPSNARVCGVMPKERIHSMLQAAGLLMLSGSEVCPTMLLEAWAAGTPVVALDRDGSAELMRWDGDVVGGALYDNDPVAAVHFVLDNRDRLSREGRELVKQQYQWKDIWARYEGLYATLW